MKTYQVASRTNYLSIGGFCAVLGLPFLMINTLWSLGSVVVNDKARPDGKGDVALVVFGLLGGCVVCYFAWQYLARYPYVIFVPGDGTIELRRVLGKSRINAYEIRSIQKRVAKVTLEGHDARLIRLRLERGAVDIPYFEQAAEFLAEIAAMQPGAAIQDGW